VRVTNDERVVDFESMRAERIVAARLYLDEVDARLEPLSIRVHEGNEGDRRAAELGRDAREIVERRFGGRVQDADIGKRAETRSLVLGNRRFSH